MRKRLTLADVGIGVLMFLVCWQLLAWGINREIMPSPVLVLPLFADMLTGELGQHLLVSTGRVLTAMFLAAIFAVPIGLGLGQSSILNRVFSPLIAIIYPIPKIVLLPVIYVLMGITDFSKIFLITLILFFQILVMVRDEAANLRPELILSVRSLGAGRRALFRFVYLPASLPAVLTSLRVSVGTAIAVLFIAEQSLTRYGLGYYIVVKTYQVQRYPEMYTGILAMGLLGLALYFALDVIEQNVNRHLYIDDHAPGDELMTDSQSVTPLQAWMMAARPKTLPAAVGPVLVGAGLAIHDGVFALLPVLAALAGALLLQIGVNMANDYFDHAAGIDTADRLGPTRVAASGLVESSQLKWWMIGVFGAAALIGVYLVIVGGWPILIIGLASILVALAYSGGPLPIASHGLGDLFVFIFFGVVAVCGTYYVQAQSVNWHVVLASVSPGMLITAILIVNNLRDIKTDAKTGKRTLAVMLGPEKTRLEFILTLIIAYIIPVILIVLGQMSVWGLITLVSLFSAWPLVEDMQQKVEGRALNKTLSGTARLSLIHSLLFAIGLAL